MTTRPGAAEGRCQVLNQNGRQCRNMAAGTLDYHGDSEIYDFSGRPQWVRVRVCEKHHKTMGSNIGWRRRSGARKGKGTNG